MLFNLNEFLMSVSFALDFVEIDLLGVTSNHGKRTAYISLRVAKEIGLSLEELHDIVALSILHDNGISEKSLHDELLGENSLSVKGLESVKRHCTFGEENIRQYPFLTKVENVIKYHHEKYDGTGFFNLRGNEIPLMSQIIHMADIIEINFNLENNDEYVQKKILEFVYEQIDKSFSKIIINAFDKVTKDKEFWVALREENIDRELRNNTPQYTMELPIEKIMTITGLFQKS